MEINKNNDISFALNYHDRTKHSEYSVRNSRHYLDWNNRPFPFKLYANLPSIPLPIDFPKPQMNPISAVNLSNLDNEKDSQLSDNFSHEITLKNVASMLFYSYGINRILDYSFGKYYMRTASGTGALYPIEIYLVTQKDISGLRAGVYHYNPIEFSLTGLRYGDYRKSLASFTNNNHDILTSPLSLIFTSLAWRNAWKYQARSYRHWFWDTGVIVANLLAVNKSMNFNTNLIMGYIDDKVNHLLYLRDEEEASILIASIGKQVMNNNEIPSPDEEKKDMNLDFPSVLSLSRREHKYPDIWDAYNSSKLFETSQIMEWTSDEMKNNIRLIIQNEKHDKPRSVKKYLLQKNNNNFSISSIGDTILKRGSARRFSRSAISFEDLSSIILNSTSGVPMDFKHDSHSLIDLYLVVNYVNSLEKGGYFYDRFTNSLELINDKISYDASGHLCLDQPLFSDASVVIFLMADLKKILEYLGNRGYRAAQMEAGIILGKIYLLSYAYNLGASGSTFYDDEVKDLFSPHSIRKETMIAVGIGNTGYKSRSGSILPVRLSREELFKEYQKIQNSTG